MAEKKYLDETGLADVAGHVNSRLKTVTSMPLTATVGAVRLYVGTDNLSYKNGHTYQYQSNGWVDITPPDSTAREMATCALNSKLTESTSFPQNPSAGDTFIYTGVPSAGDPYITGHIYQYQSNAWVDISTSFVDLNVTNLTASGRVNTSSVCSCSNLVEQSTCNKITCAVDIIDCASGYKTVNACCGVNVNSPITCVSNTTHVETLQVGCQVEGRLEVTGDIRSRQDIIAECNLSVHGNLLVDGSIVSADVTNVATSGDFVVTRENNASPMTSGEYSGLAVNNYCSGMIATLTADYKGTWRVSDSATSQATTYTDISGFHGNFYTGLSQTPISGTGPIHVITAINAVELSEVALDSQDNYYHKEATKWYGPLSIVNGAFNLGNEVTDATKLAELNALNRYELVYYNSVTDTSIDSSVNQPLLTRAEASSLHNNDLLAWDCANEKAVNVPRPSTDGTFLKANINPTTSAVSYTWEPAGGGGGSSGAVCCYDTWACAQAAIAIPEGSAGYIPDNALIVVTEQVSYVCVEAR